MHVCVLCEAAGDGFGVIWFVRTTMSDNVSILGLKLNTVHRINSYFCFSHLAAAEDDFVVDWSIGNPRPLYIKEIKVFVFWG